MVHRHVLRSVAAALLLVLTLAPSQAAVPQFRKHVLDAKSEYPACAVLDVNADGKPDIVSGGAWYEAPSWRQHHLRDVQNIRGRFDDYSNLPLDVDGDGLLDLVSANYRSQSIFWIQNSGKAGVPWKSHVVATPGAMETGRLADVDGDGRLDVLPNGVKFAAWWSVTTDSDDKVAWTRHDLPQQAAGHGIGFGDVDGDGQGDIVGVRGWFRAPRSAATKDASQGRWVWQPEFELHRDGALPILVQDVDEDGDADVIWARGHRTGIYWLEQTTEDGERHWVKHAIDTSFSQFHSLLSADLDGDGRVELIAGKRYLGHDGKDVGEWDPMAIVAYSFQSQTHTWKRTVLSLGDGIGFGLDPKAADVDADGDIDLVCPGRGGLYWLENLRGADALKDTGLSQTVSAISYDEHTQPLTFKDAEGRLHPVTNDAEWGRRRAHIVANVERVMGPLPSPARRVPLDLKVLSTTDVETYVRKKITYASEPGDRVPAYLLVPKKIEGRLPAMLCLHQTTKSGKDEPAGLGGRPTLHYADELARRGYVCLVPDYPSFGDYAYDFTKQGAHYRSGSMKAVWNNVRGIDLLEAIPEVDPDRIGCIGHSLGGHNTIFTSVFDQRIAAAVTSCGFTPFHHYYGGKLKGWTSDRYMPLIDRQFGNDPDRVPFDFYELIAAISPRAFFSNSPTRDSNFDISGVRKLEATVRPVYQLTDSRKHGQGTFVIVTPNSAHDFPDEIREQAYNWLDKRLK